MKKLLSILLTAVMLLCLFIPAFAAEKNPNTPIIYVRGQGGSIMDSEGHDLINGLEFDTKKIATGALDALAKTYLSMDYSFFTDYAKDVLSDFFPALGNDGELIADEHPVPSSFSRIKSNYGFSDYSFNYDWRLDPIYNSELLSDYIDRVLEYTNAGKVALVSFSEGSCVCGAYLTYHGSDKIDSYTMISPACNGIDIVGALAAGECKFDSKMLDKFVTYYVEGGNVLGNSSLESLLSAFASILARVKVLGYGTAFLQDLYNGINKETAFVDIILGCYPGFWSFVNDDYYEAALNKNFAGREAEFSSLIEKIKRYHTEVYRTLPQTLESLKNDGLKINVIAKYGSASFPIIKDIDIQSDGVVELHNASFGATSAKLGETLSNVDPDDRYVSADKVIDASTCLFKDSTWFIEGMVHGNEESNALQDFTVLLTKSASQATIDDYPQFMQYSLADDSLSELTANNDNSAKWSGNIVMNFIKFLKSIFAMIKEWFTKA